MLPRRGFLLGTAAAGWLGLGATSRAVAQAANVTLLQRFVLLNRNWGEFSTLIAAVQAVDLTGPLAGADPLTVFAPTDDAFAALGLDASNIGSVPLDALAGILLYHVAAGSRGANAIGSLSSLTMLDGGTVSVKRRRLFGSPSGLYLDQSLVVFPNLVARNGVIHVIDRVLQPASAM
jgi:uncharacterized surface protein with fasciclin (FAS1) repeats